MCSAPSRCADVKEDACPVEVTLWPGGMAAATEYPCELAGEVVTDAKQFQSDCSHSLAEASLPGTLINSSDKM